MLPRPSATFVPTVSAADLMRPSLSPVCDMSVSMATPSKSRFMMKLIAPDMASEPYEVEAPPVRMSTRSSSAVGMTDVSTRPLKLYGVMRLPSISRMLR